MPTEYSSVVSANGTTLGRNLAGQLRLRKPVEGA